MKKRAKIEIKTVDDLEKISWFFCFENLYVIVTLFYFPKSENA